MGTARRHFPRSSSRGQPNRIGYRQRRSQDFFLGGGATRYIFVTPLREPTAFSGGGVVTEIFPVSKSITFPRFRDIFGTFSGHLRIVRRFMDIAEIQGRFPCLLTHSNHVTTSIHSGKKTFNKSLGGPWPPWPPLATPLDTGSAFDRVNNRLVSKTRATRSSQGRTR